MLFIGVEGANSVVYRCMCASLSDPERSNGVAQKLIIKGLEWFRLTEIETLLLCARVAIGIGRDINEDELRGIASPPGEHKTVFTVADFKDLNAILSEFMLETCHSSNTSTTVTSSTSTPTTTTATTTTSTTTPTTTTRTSTTTTTATTTTTTTATTTTTVPLPPFLGNNQVQQQRRHHGTVSTDVLLDAT